MNPDEIEQIKQAFEKADKGGGGKITRDALGKIMRQLDTDPWSEKDLNDLFNLVSSDGQDTIGYDKFVNYVMCDDDTDEPDNDADEGGQADAMENEAHMELAHVDLKQRVKRNVFVMLATRMGEDEEDAANEYDEILVSEDHDVSDGIPLEDLLDELNIERRDREALANLEKALTEIRAKVDAHQEDAHQANRPCGPIGIDKILRWCCVYDKKYEDAPQALQDPEANMSHASYLALSKLSDKELIEKVKQCNLDPVVLPVQAGQIGNRECCTKKVQDIINKCKADGTKYTDPNFDLLNNPLDCLYVDRKTPGYDCTVAVPHAYKRLSELFVEKGGGGGGGMFAMMKAAGSKVCLYKGEHAQESDVCQGQIGTCYFLGALGSIISNNPNIVKKWFIKYDVDVGVYGIRMCHDGEWTHIIVDDVVPVDQYDNLIYAHSKDPKEVWSCLLEKAFCKMHTCFEMCDGGRPSEAIFGLLGGCGGKFVIDKKHKAKPPAYFKVINNAFERGMLLTTGFSPPKGATSGQGKCGESVCDSGLVAGHVYSIMDLVEIKGEHLIKIRNPWGTGEWKGKWSDENANGEWTEELIHSTGKEFKDDGTFWMCIQDFVKNSTGVAFSRTFNPSWKKCSHYQRFVDTGEMEATALWAYKAGSADELSLKKGETVEVVSIHKGWWNGHHPGETKNGFFPGNYVKLKERPVAKFEVCGGTPDAGKDAVKVVILGIQQNVLMMRKFYKRKQDGLNYKDTSYPDAQLTCVGPDGKVVWQKSGKRRELFGELTVKPGETYSIYGCAMDGKGGAFMIRAYMQNGTVKLVEKPAAKMAEVTAAMNKR